MKHPPEPPTHVLFDFKNPSDIEAWQMGSDRVMGGVSSGQFISSEGGVAEFTGTVSLENNGGFVSLRSAGPLMDLSAYTGLRLSAHGDGRPYAVTIRSKNMPHGVKYHSPIKLRAGEWASYDVKFADLIPKYRGRILQDADELDLTAIQSIGLLIADGVSASFKLKLRSISAW
jgi:NADH dehydrogenase [ubiquinone] 1 alpha subcomplex assembly factor 1